jgi:hypothetical protein
LWLTAADRGLRRAALRGLLEVHHRHAELVGRGRHRGDGDAVVAGAEVDQRLDGVVVHLHHVVAAEGVHRQHVDARVADGVAARVVEQDRELGDVGHLNAVAEGVEGEHRQAIGVEQRIAVGQAGARLLAVVQRPAQRIDLLADRQHAGGDIGGLVAGAEVDRVAIGSAVDDQVVEADHRVAVGDVDGEAGAAAEVERDGVVAGRAVDGEMGAGRREIAHAVEQRDGVVAGAAEDADFAGERLDLDGVAEVVRAAAAADVGGAGHRAQHL